ncbi:hypothetical protein [Myceligenerans crystallogenes]|uniref:Secreted protein n=1 Tax=Myceligenerans crystallogenes TaxID=316335 RepID=A0ABN2NBT2_9MICO
MVRKKTTGAAACAFATALVIGLAGCTSSEPDPDQVLQELQESAAAEAGSPSAEAPASKSPKEVAVEDAKAAVQEYYRVKNLATSDPTKFDIEMYETVATGTNLSSLRDEYNIYVANEGHSVGELKIDSIKVIKVDLTNKPKADPPVVPSIELAVCIDSTDFDIVGKDGKSVVKDGAVERSIDKLGLRHDDYPNGNWIVEYVANGNEVKPC